MCVRVGVCVCVRPRAAAMLAELAPLDHALGGQHGVVLARRHVAPVKSESSAEGRREEEEGGGRGRDGRAE